MLRPHLADAFRYTAWADRRVADALSVLGPDMPPGALRSFSHVARAEAIWLGRVLGTADARLAVWEDDPLAVAADRAERASAGWAAHLLSVPEAALAADVTYQNSRGEAFTTPLDEIAAHTVAHGAYHRGQIAQLLRAAGHAPPATDRIVYARIAVSER